MTNRLHAASDLNEAIKKFATDWGLSVDQALDQIFDTHTVSLPASLREAWFDGRTSGAESAHTVTSPPYNLDRVAPIVEKMTPLDAYQLGWKDGQNDVEIDHDWEPNPYDAKSTVGMR